jgi:hypothetical protein
MLRSFVALTFALSLIAFSGTAANAQIQQYAGQQDREIKSLSADDIAELKAGKGWGLAKPAELNGYPGPSHVLELKEKLGLTPGQEAGIKGLFDEMKAAAVPLGLKLIDLERDLDELYISKTVNSKNLEELLLKIGEVRSRLRFAHLSAHLKTVEILSKEQVAKYNELRGYGKTDPCKNVPEGHDPAMWKKHNGCSE